MNLTYEKQMTIAVAQALIQKYGAVIEAQNFAEVIGLEPGTLAVKMSKTDNDLPKYTQLRGKRVFMASDIAEWMVLNNLKFPK